MCSSSQVLACLQQHGQRLAVVETCTGGAVTARLAAMPGASKVLAWSLVAYDHASKPRVLGCDAQVFIQHGSVSPQAVKAMAQAAFKLGQGESGVTLALAISGIAGPGGGSTAKPVGTCFMALTAAAGTRVHALDVRQAATQGRQAYQQAVGLAVFDILASSVHDI